MLNFAAAPRRRGWPLALLTLMAAGLALLLLTAAGLLFGVGPIPQLDPAVVEAPGPAAGEPAEPGPESAPEGGTGDGQR